MIRDKRYSRIGQKIAILAIILALSFSSKTRSETTAAQSSLDQILDDAIRMSPLKAPLGQSQNESHIPSIKGKPDIGPATPPQPQNKVCCRHCAKGQPCGNSCISLRYTC